MAKKSSTARNASKKAMQKKAARKKALAKKGSGPSRDNSAFGFNGMDMSGMGMSGMGMPNFGSMGAGDMDSFFAQMEQANAWAQRQRELKAPRNKARFAQNAQANEGVNYFLVKVSYTKAASPVWRRLVISADAPVSVLHSEIQDVFDWDTDHMSCFCWDTACQDDFSVTVDNPWTFVPNPKVREVLREGAKIGYNYNFFHDMIHVIEVEKAMVEINDYDPNLQMEQGEPPEMPGTAILMPLPLGH